MRTAIIAAFLFLLVSTLYSQDELPVRTNASEEYISMTGDTPFAKAMTIFGNAFKRFTQKPLVYETTATKNGKVTDQLGIGLNIPNMYWRDAFDIVLRFNKYWYFETPDYVRVYEIGGGLDTAGITKKAMTTKEVEISAIFFEANRSAMDQLGVDWTAILNSGTTMTTFDVINVGVNGSGSGTGSSGTGGSGSGSGSGSGAASIDYGAKFKVDAKGTPLSLLATLKAIQSENLGELISCPSVMVRSGETGRIHVGQDFSVKQRDFSGNTIEKFYSAGTIIEVVPTIMSEDSLEFVEMKIKAERSSVFPDPVSTVINKTEAQSAVVLIDGEETVVGGLFTNDAQSIRRGIPLLKDLPWWVFGLRYVFGYSEDQVTKKELIIILKAKIIKSIQDRMLDKVAEIKQGQNALEHASRGQQDRREELLRQIEAAKTKK